jgi:hypothetical protein
MRSLLASFPASSASPEQAVDGIEALLIDSACDIFASQRMDTDARQAQLLTPLTHITHNRTDEEHCPVAWAYFDKPRTFYDILISLN